MLDILLNWIYPPRCLFCREIISSGYCCAKCEKALIPYRYVHGMEDNQLWRWFSSPFWYSGLVRDAIVKMKYSEDFSYARGFALAMAESLSEQEFDCIISVPAYRKNQDSPHTADLLAKHLAKLLNIPWCKKGLKKVRFTMRQHDLNYRDRIRNLNDCFEANSHLVKNKRILLCDDIITSGATLSESAKALKQGGAAWVYAVTAAVAGKKSSYDRS